MNAASNTVLVVDTSGKTIHEFGRLRDPLKISMDRFSNVYVTNKIESCIYKFIQKKIRISTMGNLELIHLQKLLILQ